MNISSASNRQKTPSAAKSSSFLLSPSFTECSKMMERDPFRESQWIYMDMNICICPYNCALCGSWQEKLCLRNGRRIWIGPVPTQSILKIMFSNWLHGNANTISWYIVIFEFIQLDLGVGHQPHAQENTTKTTHPEMCHIHDQYK